MHSVEYGDPDIYCACEVIVASYCYFEKYVFDTIDRNYTKLGNLSH